MGAVSGQAIVDEPIKVHASVVISRLGQRATYYSHARNHGAVPEETGAEETATSKAITALSDVLKLVISAVAIVYVAGGAVMWVRLHHKDVPSDPVVSVLPREFLISIGLRTIVAPALLFATAGLVLALLWKEFRGERQFRRLVLVGLVVALAVVGRLSFIYIQQRNWWVAGLLVGLVVTLAVGYLLFRYVDTSRTTVVVIVVVIAAGLGGIVGRVLVEWRDDTSAPTTVCLKDSSTPIHGDYIGETDKTIYLAEPVRKAIASIPKDRAAEIHVAERGAGHPDCQLTYPLPQPPAAPPPAPPPPAAPGG